MLNISFKPITTRRLSEYIENHIRELILKGKLKSGDKLPPEREIAKQFGVSVVTVREALRGLEAFGLIQKKRQQGGGTFVSSVRLSSIKIALHNFLSSRNFSYNHLAEVRRIIEPTMVRLAASRITSQELEAIESNIKYCEKHIKKAKNFSEKEFFDIEEKNVEFHRMLAEATKNPILALTIDYIMDFTLSFKKSVLTPDIKFSSDIINGHLDIFDSLKNRDEEGAETAMIAHLKELGALLSISDIGKSPGARARRSRA